MEIKKVLLVDDDPDIREVARLSLSAVGGWDVFLASSGSEALDIVEELRPDLILLDVMMPEMDGTSTFIQLREIEKISGVPIIFVTAKVQKSEMERYEELGASGCIRKPFDPMTLPDQIREIVKSKKMAC